MTVTLPDVPPPPPPSVVRFANTGQPTSAQVEYETRVLAFMRAVKKALEALP